MPSEEELIIEVDEHDNILGARKKSDFYGGKLIHRSVSLLLINEKNELLICQRSNDKHWSPGLYTHSVSGGVGDESYDEGIIRELYEELGVQGTVTFLYKYFFEHPGVNRMWKAVYMCKWDGKVTLDSNEIQSAVWTSFADLEENIRTHSDCYTESFIKSMDIFGKMVKEGSISL